MPRQHRTYAVMDIAHDGRATVERFCAIDDESARKRAIMAAQGVSVSLWQGDQIVARWTRTGRSFRAH